MLDCEASPITPTAGLQRITVTVLDCTPGNCSQCTQFPACIRGPDRSTPLRAQRDLLRQFKLIPPVQSCLQKDIRSRLTQITSISPAVPPPFEGRFAIVTDVGGGMRWTRMAL